MTPQERQLIDDLFDRLAKLESAKRDPEAMSAIMQGLRNAPNAVYALVQTALVQDEALKRADMRIQELEAGAGQQEPGQSGGFLDSMRDAIFGQNQSHGSVPNVRAPEHGRQPAGVEHRPGDAAGPTARTIQSAGLWPALWRRTAAAAFCLWRRWRLVPRNRGGGRGRRGRRIAAGRQHPLDDGRRRQPPGFGDTAGHSGGIEDRRPWSDQSGGDLARDAGINDIGSSGRRADNNDNDSGSRQGFFDQASNDDDDMDHDSDGFDGDDGDGDSDYA